MDTTSEAGVLCVQRALGGGGGEALWQAEGFIRATSSHLHRSLSSSRSSVGGDHSSESLGKDSIVAIQLGMAVGRLPSMATFLFKGAMLLGMLLAISGPFSCSHSQLVGIGMRKPIR